jgi:hypothetical protein
VLVSFWLLGGRGGELSALLRQCGPVAVVYSFVWFVCTLHGERMRRARREPTGPSRPRAVAFAYWVVFLTLVVGPPVLLEAWQRTAGYADAVLLAAILIVWTPLISRVLAEISAARIRAQEEWASLPID